MTDLQSLRAIAEKRGRPPIWDEVLSLLDRLDAAERVISVVEQANNHDGLLFSLDIDLCSFIEALADYRAEYREMSRPNG